MYRRNKVIANSLQQEKSLSLTKLFSILAGIVVIVILVFMMKNEMRSERQNMDLKKFFSGFTSSITAVRPHSLGSQ